MICDNMLLRSKSNADSGEVMQSLTHLIDGNVSDASSGMRRHCSESENRGDGSFSSATEWTNDQRLDVTRAVSECSITDDDDEVNKVLLDSKSSACAEDLKLEMDVLESEYNLLRVQKELALRNSSKQCVEMNGAVHMTQPICASTATAHSILMDMGDTLYSQSSFAREALGRMQDISNESAYRVPQEDPTFPLQDRLQKLLLAAVLEHECPAHSGSQFGFEDVQDTSGWFGTTMIGKDSIWKDVPKNKRCLTDSAAHEREISLELEEMKKALASQNRENRSCFRRHSQQTVAEEMYCKETIRQIVQQVQSEIEQWSQMQDILHNLQEELEGLSELQKLWEDRALRAEAQLKCLQEEVNECRLQARSSEEELVSLRCEKQILKNKIDMIEDAQMNISGIVREVEEKPRCASVGTQHEGFALCESFVHSRNESGRSSVDLGTLTQKSFRKSIKKSLDFASNPSKFRFGNLGLSKVEPTGLEFSSKKVDVCNSKGKPKNHKASGHFMNLNTTKLDRSESTYGHEYKERKKARLFASKENRSVSASISAPIPFISENAQDGLLGHVVNAGRDYADRLFLSKSKSSLPSAPASTPSRIPLGDIVNISKHDNY